MVLELALIVILSIIVVYLLIQNLRWKFDFDHKVKESIEMEEERIRQDAIQRSARVLSGKTLEKLVPFLDRFPYNPHDVRWLGDPVDLVIFDGYSSRGSPTQVVFCEVKSGESKLSNVQKKIRDLIQSKRVTWFEFRSDI